MRILALDTTGPYCTAALVNDSRIITASSENIGKGHAERLAPMTQEILAKANMPIGRIDRFAVCTGPGSFTGLRVSLAFARALALPGKTPVIGISSLACWAAQADPEGAQRVLSAADVKRGEVCWALYEGGREILTPRTDSVDAARKALSQIKFDSLTGSGAHLLGGAVFTQPVSGAVLGWLAADKDPELYPAAPFYSRPPDAKAAKTAA